MSLASRRSTTKGQKRFATIPNVTVQRSKFNRSSGTKTTFDASNLIPFWVDEALPGDTFNMKVTALARLATPLHPVMDNMRLSTFFFAVPNRLLWENWEKFNGAQANPGDSTDFTIPQITSPAGGFTAGSLEDHFGMALGVDTTVNAFWHRAYHLIWNEWFRDQNLSVRANQQVSDGDVPSSSYAIRRRGKRHDYFTSCLPFPQKGASVTIPLGDTAPISSIGQPTFGTATTADQPISVRDQGSGSDSGDLFKTSVHGSNTETLEWGNPNLEADLSSATATTINQLREAFQIQRMLERDARGGTRYTEVIRSHFGVTSDDARLQRPEYLGGGVTPIEFRTVPQSSAAFAGGTAQANLAAYAVAGTSGHGFTKSFTEHCTLIGMVCVTSDLTYQQGMPRMFKRLTRFDYFWPSLAHLGEQAVMNSEIYMDGTAADDEVFGYQGRYEEYRYKPSTITNQFRSSHPLSLDVWHLAQDFTSRPLLNETFILENVPVDRIIAVPGQPHFLFDAFFDLQCARPMPSYSTPGLIDHF